MLLLYVNISAINVIFLNDHAYRFKVCDTFKLFDIEMKFLCKWIYDQICEYNLFASETDGNNEPGISTTKIKREKYATWLYVLLVVGE